MKTIEEVKRKYEQELELIKVEEMLIKKFNNHDFKMMVYQGSSKITVSIDLTDQPIELINKQLLDIATVLEPTVMTHEIKHKKTMTHMSPYLLRTDSQFNGGVKVMLEWYCKFYVRIKLPTEFYGEVLSFGTRHLTSTEKEVYFSPSYTMKEVNNMQRQTARFSEFQSVSWYGGHTTCFTEDIADRDLYERMVFIGTTT